jgi:hypothetical protein
VYIVDRETVITPQLDTVALAIGIEHADTWQRLRLGFGEKTAKNQGPPQPIQPLQGVNPFGS